MAVCPQDIRELIGKVEHQLILAEQSLDLRHEDQRLEKLMKSVRELRDTVRRRRREVYAEMNRRCPHGILMKFNCKRCGRVVR